MKFCYFRAAYFLIALLLLLSGMCTAIAADSPTLNIPAKPLIDFTSPDAPAQVKPIDGNPSATTITVDKSGISVLIPSRVGKADHVGFRLFPAHGEKFWDLSAYGHVEARITNLSHDKNFNVVMHVVDDHDQFSREQKTEFLAFQPGQTRILKVIFGYQHGFRPGPPVHASNIAEIYFYFRSGSSIDRSFRIETLEAAGVTGEKPEAKPTPPSANP